MDKTILIEKIFTHVTNSGGNYIGEDIALSKELAGMRIFEEPLVGFADADDAAFEKFKSSDVIGPHFMTPKEWTREAKTVISFFLPFTERVKESAKINFTWPSNEWMHGRIEGQKYINELCLYIKNILEQGGYSGVIPSLDKRFSLKSPFTADKGRQEYYTSNWSERHAAYVCALGTFGLSKGLITGKGIAGRIGSLITNAYFDPDKRPYDDFRAYCTRCGACIRNCPVGAISFEQGKIHSLCSSFLDTTLLKHKPWYGCGKCQVSVPCENKRPGNKTMPVW
jgi:epoxyqueuosine reductase QueG